MEHPIKPVLITSGVLLGTSFLLITVTHQVILTPNFYEKSGQALTAVPGQDLLLYARLEKWFYIYHALYLMFKVGAITLLLYTALFLLGRQASFLALTSVVMAAEMVFVLGAAAKVVYFHYYYPQGTLLDWHRVYILSVLSAFPDAPADWYYALQTANVFELAYWGLLVMGLRCMMPLPFGQALRLVLLSYVPALVIWICIVSFCSLLLFPELG
ncbi:hypothetical protein [Mucilaginibacter lacusdianchii]|uniref:hypothetical protein n=1 Tax=Mucilaginibacter lacusdianchii TaxID=2684211 RepID=UPI00131E91B7|nr:hypothetical protein [Mucilaginibacter sp. JXJ CY 39]